MMKFMIRAYEEASKSLNPSNQNGALLVWKGEVLLTSYCTVPGKPPNEVNQILRESRLRQLYVSHAVESLLMGASSLGIPTAGLIIICPWLSCLICARLIIMAKIKRVTVHHQRMLKNTNLESIRTKAWLMEAGIEFTEFEGPIPEAASIRVNGERWQP